MLRPFIPLVVVYILLAHLVDAQQFKYVPLCGAVTPNSATVYVRTSVPVTFELLLSTDSSDFSSAIIYNGQTVDTVDNAGKVVLTGLTPDAYYYYKAQIAGQDTTPVCRFRTFPLSTATPTFTFAFGSCQSPGDTANYNEPIFRQVIAANPRFFLQCGDWGYPDTTDKASSPDNVFPAVYQRVLNSYHARYSGIDVQELMRLVPIDYIWDDHDYANNNASQTTSSYSNTDPFTEVPFLPGSRANSLRGYDEHFPHYPLPDISKGIYHSIRFGNVEIFMCDDRSSRSPNNNSLVYNNGIYTYNEPAGHSILGADQMVWLLDGLRNSDANWKFIVSGVTFNKGFRKLIGAVSGNSLLQNLTVPGLGTGKAAIAAAIDTWSGFQRDQDTLLAHLQQYNIKNVVFLSSDSHTAAIDDGTNAGIPELMSGNLHKNNSRIAQLLSQASSIPLLNADLDIWNGGGQGLGNSNFEYTFGKIDVFGNDSCRLSIVDVNGAVIASLTLCDGGQPCQVSGVTPQLVGNAISLFPNPTTQTISLQIQQADRVGQVQDVFLANVLGQRLQAFDAKLLTANGGLLQVDISNLAAGMYYLGLRSDKGLFVKSFQKN